MMSIRRRALACLVVAPVVAGRALAHPGHEGHELTWDLSHLAQHPWAVVGALALVGVGVFLGRQVLRARGAVRDQSLRASQASRGK